MNKEQFFTFKSDFKKGVQIVKNNNAHKKAYYNDGFATKEDQDVAILESRKEVNRLIDSMTIKINAESPVTHWAYYCAKHQLDESNSIKYVEEMLKQMKQETKERMYFYNSPAENIYQYSVKKIIDAYAGI